MQVKKTLLFVVLALFVLGMPAVALASGWTAPTAGVSPHTGWLDTTNYCNQCHAIHEAEDATYPDGEYLLRSSSAGACDLCHVNPANPFGIAQVYDADPANYALDTGFEHTLIAAVDVPDSADPAGTADPLFDYNIDFSCLSCHSVHGANCIPGSAILLEDPIGDLDAATTETEFCADCHDNNDVTGWDNHDGNGDEVSHIMTANLNTPAGVQAASSASTDCRDCHSGGGFVQANSWPHLTAGAQFLVDTYDGNGNGGEEMDTVCLDCHAGLVGSNF
ncbi:MAG: hypothetical protein FDZ70_04600 [Actinobacteria bacterium]|nr:MAG: hypothetical protein FDZ70_04600 [Actinomycetota bacterium]